VHDVHALMCCAARGGCGRVRAQNDTELLVAESMDVDSTSKHTRKPAATFEYDKVFGPASSQQQVFDEVRWT
jgi:hypothetical protein